ncbi:flagellin [Tepidicella xavieri]|uniref:Flagellin n=1 Tax=Tepidicella xavieri TaxID=360241 RepID=A0A4R6UF10_9BURK|nr:flagellin [Tepidicella xavieri]TDQ45341.1 flagellin [Tepidicella xavieri]
MATTINTNIFSLNAQRNLAKNSAALGTTIERLSSGLRVNSAKDDAAGLAIAERFTTQIRGLNQAVRNANDGISLAQVAEGALSNIGNNLQRIRELAVQSANATNSASDRAALQAEVAQLVGEISRIAESTNFNGLKLLDGSYKLQQYQVGANAGDTIGVSVADARATALGATTLTSDPDGLTERIPSNVAVNGTFVVNGVNIDTSGLTNGDISGLIARIDAQNSATGVTAARATVTQANFAVAPLTGTDIGAIRINGTAISFSQAQGATVADIVERINEFSTQTGVTAEANGTSVRLISSTGADIKLQDFGATLTGGATIFTGITTEETFVAGIELRTRVGGTITVTGTAAADLFADTTNGEANTYTVNGLTIATVEGANNAIKAVDFALQSVNNARADLGAVQNRFNAVVANLQVNAENLSASRSRIQDADFAAETAALSRAQILQQAGTAMVAQANQVPQGVLQLLQR